MRPTYLLTVVAFATSAAAALQQRRELPSNVPMRAAAVTGAEYDCHADCGYGILNATGDYCNNAGWLNDDQGCLKCANVYDLWPDYGSGVSAAAKGCGLTAVPEAAASAASSTTIVASVVSSTAEVHGVSSSLNSSLTSTGATKIEINTAEPTSNPTSFSSTVTTSTSTAVITTVAGNRATPTPTSVPVAGAGSLWVSSSLLTTFVLITAYLIL